MQYWIISLSINSFIAIWVLLGTALAIVVLTFFFWSSLALVLLLLALFLLILSLAFYSQQPGPVGRIVFIPDLKSGIPQAVDIPAPVKK